MVVVLMFVILFRSFFFEGEKKGGGVNKRQTGSSSPTQCDPITKRMSRIEDGCVLLENEQQNGLDTGEKARTWTTTR